MEWDQATWHTSPSLTSRNTGSSEFIDGVISNRVAVFVAMLGAMALSEVALAALLLAKFPLFLGSLPLFGPFVLSGL